MSAAGAGFYDKWHQGKHTIEFTTEKFDPEKFAELIVQECICLVLNGKHDNEKFDINDKFHCGHNIALENASEGIAKHFGVEK
jgi:hypothetical protein